MKKKTLFIMFISIVLAWTITAPPVRAGSPQQHLWQGVAIGVGAAIIGGSLFHHARHSGHSRKHMRRHSRPAYYQTSPPQQVYVAPACPPRQPRGHWELQKTWVPSVCEKTWNPGHYNRKHRWIPGRWIRIETQPGYFRTEKVWVSY